MSDSRYYKRTIMKEQMNSKILNDTRNLRVYLPPGYNELSSYPVIYCQDGEQFFNFGRVATHATRLILDEDLEPVIIVGIDVKLANRTAEYAPDGDRFQLYKQFFIDELLPFVEEKYPVRKDVDNRIVAGDSLGGTVSLHLALDHPELFRKVISLSGAFLDRTQARVELEDDLSWLDLYMLIGLQEDKVKTDRGTYDFLEANRVTKEILLEKKTKLEYVEKDGEHLWGFWQNELDEILAYFLKG
ncbi:alpha/beta hydrolase [Chengkuizengella axinellae]|uniref:Alpha/beta hydrolase-fold protein n=1 Tax=Chengkuizengella axinellae TaxID=3064388 RepID=A0ABT9IZ92_9BACL|nr:alpha/beta hydrolase-fold protein [Chengkuizengella sp. 2205SS18-9]MDP5274689.1 alpha/beta hydrolase-fold protein [Chengkuizengella sp. 2205SS18-9]